MAVTLIVEDGTGVAGANTYVTLAESDTYFAGQGNQGAAWAAPDALKNEYLANAATALDALFGRKYISYLPSADVTVQGLLWPRENVWDRHNRRIPAGTIPQVLKDAQCEMALLLQQGTDLFPESNANNNLLSESVAIGEISQSYTLQRQNEDVATYEDFRKVELILWSILKPKSRKMKFTL